MGKKSKRSSALKRFLHLMKDFSLSTSLHGYSYLSSADSILAKILWAIVIVAASGLGIVFFVSNTKEFMKGTVVTYIESETSPLDVSIYIIHK